MHGDLTAMREPAQAFLRDVESQPRSPEAGVAHRVYGVTRWFAGDFIEARSHLEQAVAIFDPERDRDLAFRFGQDVGVSAMVYLAIVLWPLGEVDRARELVDATATRIAELGHLATSTYGLMHSAMFEIIGRNVDRAAPLAKALSSVAHEHGIALWIAFGAFLEAWVELRSGFPEIGLLNMRRAAALLQQDGVGAFQPLVKTALAEAEARNGETEAALATIEQALEDPIAQDSAGSTQRPTASAAKSSSRKTPPTPPPPKTPSSPPSPSRNPESPQLRTARRALARKTLSRDRPRRRRARRARPRAGRLRADAGVSGNRGGIRNSWRTSRPADDYNPSVDTGHSNGRNFRAGHLQNPLSLTDVTMPSEAFLASRCGVLFQQAASPSRGPGNGILWAETGGRFQPQNAGERPEFGSQTATRLTNRPELRGFLPARKPRRFARIVRMAQA